MIINTQENNFSNQPHYHVKEVSLEEFLAAINEKKQSSNDHNTKEHMKLLHTQLENSTPIE